MSVARHTSYNITGAVIPLIVALFTIPLYLQSIGAERFGLLSIAWLILGYFGIFDLGLGRAVAHRIANNSGASEPVLSKILGTAIACNLGIGLVGAAILWIVSYVYFSSVLDAPAELRAQMVSAIPLLAMSVPVTALTGVLSGALEGRSRFAAVNGAVTAASVLFHTFPLAVSFLFGPDLQWLIAAAVFARLLGVAMLWLLCRRHFTSALAVDRQQAGALLGFGGWIALSSFVGPLMVISDRFVIGALLGPIAVAAYAIPFEIAARSATLPTSLGRALFPELSKPRHKEELIALSTKGLHVLATLMTPAMVGGILFMETFLWLWLGDVDQASVMVGAIILVAYWFNSMSYVPLTLILGRGRPRTVALIHCSELVPYSAILFFATMEWGIVGAAIAFTIRCCFDYLLMLRFSGLLRAVWFKHLLFGQIVLVAMLAALSGLRPLPMAAVATALVTASLFLSYVTQPPGFLGKLLSDLRSLADRRGTPGAILPPD